MKDYSCPLMRAVVLSISLSVFVCAGAALCAEASNNAQDTYGGGSESQPKSKEKKDKGGAPSVSEGESKMALKLNAAPDAAAKLQIAAELLKKYPKTTLRTQMINYLSGQIEGVQDNAQKITLAENFLLLFTEPAAINQINPILINAYLVANRPEDAFRVGAPWLEKNPDVGVLINLANTGLQQANGKNTKFIPQSRQYGLKAIELIEADKRPAQMDDALWQASKGRWLGQLYQTVGYLALLSGDKPEALARLQRAIALNPSNPSNYAIVGNIKNDEYQQIATQYKALPAGSEQAALLQKAYAKMDEIIDLYAHGVALSEGNAQMQQLHDSLYTDLKHYYAYRHNNSTDGLQQLIDQYKTPSKP